MQTITVETRIAAPPMRCFLLCLSIDLRERNAALKQIAESEEWQRYLNECALPISHLGVGDGDAF